MKKLFVIAAALLVGAVSFAQETNKDANGKTQFGPYETNKFWDNWFVEVGGGVNIANDQLLGKIKGTSPIETGLGLAVKANVGKWFDPVYGARIGWTGLANGELTKGFLKGDFAANGDKGYPYNYAHIDGLVNLSNLFAGYKETRTVDFVGFLTTGAAWQTSPMKAGRSLALGAGLEMPIRLGGVVDLVPSFEEVFMDGSVIGGKGVAGVFTATLGLNFNLGKNNWTRKSTTLAAAAAALAAAEAAANALKAQNEKYAADAAAANNAKNALANENAALKKQLADLQNQPKAVAGVDLGENPIVAYFELGKSVLSDKELAHLDYQVKTALAQNADQKLVITGKADAKTGSKALNEKLSQKRADYLFNLLTDKYGLNADNFTVANEVVDSNSALDRAAVISK